MTWTTEEEGKVFSIAIGGSLGKSQIESKGQFLVSITSNAAIDVHVSNFNSMNSFAYDSFHSFSFDCFASYYENEEIMSKELIKAVRGH